MDVISECLDALSTFRGTDGALWHGLLDPTVRTGVSTVLVLLEACWSDVRGGHYLQCVEQTGKRAETAFHDQLYASHWKDVPLVWRYRYAAVQLMRALSAASLDQWKECVQLCDRGLLLGAPLAPVTDALNTLATHACACLSPSDTVITDNDLLCGETLVERDILNDPGVIPSHQLTHASAIRRVEQPSLHWFQQECLQSGSPVIITGGMAHWNAHTRWTHRHYWHRIAGARTVPVEIGRKYTDADWSQSLMTIDDFLERLLSSNTESKDIAYLAQHSLLEQIPVLQEDMYIPDYCSCTTQQQEQPAQASNCGSDSDSDDTPPPSVVVNVWMGPCHTITPCHFDPTHNLLCQVVGYKYLALCASEYTSGLYPHDALLLSNTSRVDIDEPDLEAFPRYSHTRWFHCVLAPGEMLYIPPRMWHYVRSLSVSLSVSNWWK